MYTRPRLCKSSKNTAEQIAGSILHQPINIRQICRIGYNTSKNTVRAASVLNAGGLLLARLIGQHCFARWRLSSVGVQSTTWIAKANLQLANIAWKQAWGRHCWWTLTKIATLHRHHPAAADYDADDVSM